MEDLTCERLPDIICAAGKDMSAVSLYGAHDNDQIVIDNRPNGWVVFYTERGAECDLRTHVSEHEACRDLPARLGIGA
jgi:hypothetical protein